MRTFNPANKLLSGKKKTKNGTEKRRVGVGDGREKPKCSIFWDILNHVKRR